MKHYIIILLLFCANVMVAQENAEVKKDTVINGIQSQEIKSSSVKQKYKRTNNSEEAIKEGAAAVDRQNFKQALSSERCITLRPFPRLSSCSKVVYSLGISDPYWCLLDATEVVENIQFKS